jgi:hypothetical protein
MKRRKLVIASQPLVLELVTLLALIGLLVGCGAATGTEAPAPVLPTAEERASSSPLPPDVQVTFDADRTNVRPGECAILEWKVEGGELVQLDGLPVDASGQKTVCPDTTTTYTLAVYVGVGPPASPHTEQQVVISVGGTGEEAPTPTATAGAPAISTVAVHRDLAYGSYQLGGTGHDLLLDLYLPDQGASQRLPLLIFIHGGGWLEGSKDACPGETLALYGYAVACVDYRLGDFRSGCPEELTFPAQIEDVKAAVRWLRLAADQYGLDPGRFGALGDSSGGHLAALLGTSSGVAELERTDNPGVSDAVQAVASGMGRLT